MSDSTVANPGMRVVHTNKGWRGTITSTTAPFPAGSAYAGHRGVKVQWDLATGAPPSGIYLPTGLRLDF